MTRMKGDGLTAAGSRCIVNTVERLIVELDFD
jgi:hypothetical protein